MRRAGGAALGPVLIEHEVIDEDLPAALEELFKFSFAVPPLEDIGLFDFHHRQASPLGTEYRGSRQNDEQLPFVHGHRAPMSHVQVWRGARLAL